MVYKATDRERGGVILLEDVFTKTRRLVIDVLQEKHPDMHVPPVENPKCPAFEEYEEVPQTVPLELLEKNVTWVASKLSGAAGALGGRGD